MAAKANDETDSRKPSTTTDLQSDISRLASILTETSSRNNNGSGSQEDLGDPEDILELLQKLEAADEIVAGMEDTLDSILDGLDELLKDLEKHVPDSGDNIEQPK
jgi:ABC-type transporter Mla subunit MlaD